MLRDSLSATAIQTAKKEAMSNMFSQMMIASARRIIAPRDQLLKVQLWWPHSAKNAQIFVMTASLMRILLVLTATNARKGLILMRNLDNAFFQNVRRDNTGINLCLQTKLLAHSQTLTTIFAKIVSLDANNAIHQDLVTYVRIHLSCPIHRPPRVLGLANHVLLIVSLVSLDLMERESVRDVKTNFY